MEGVEAQLLFRGMFPFPPSANNLWMVARGKRRIVPSSDAMRFRSECGVVVREWMVARDLVADDAYTGNVEVHLMVHRPNRRYDLDNSIKACIDALKKKIIKDDNQVVRIIAEARINRNNPSAEIWVYKAVE